MADDILRIGAMIDLGQILPGLDTLASKTEAATSQMKGSFTKLQSGLILTQGAVVDLEREGGSIAPKIIPSLNQLPPALGRVGSSSHGAREAMRGIGEEIGVHMPRFVSSFLATLGPVGGIMAAAFAPIAIIGLIEFLNKIPAAIASATDSIMGFGAEQKKAFAEAVKDSDEAFSHTKNLDEINRNLAQTVQQLGDFAKMTFMEKWTAATDEATKGTSKLWYVLGLGSLVNAEHQVQGLISANLGLSDAETKAAAAQHELQKGQASALGEQRDRMLEVEKEALKVGEVGASASQKQKSELAALNLEEDHAIDLLWRKGPPEQAELDRVKALYTLKREAVTRTTGIEEGTEGIAAAKAQVEAEKSTALAIIAAQHKAAEDIVAIDKTQWAQLLVVDRRGEDEIYAVEVKAQEKLKAFALRNQSLTGKPAAPEITAINTKIETENIAHQAKMRSIDAEAQKYEIAGGERVEAAFRSQFEDQMRMRVEDNTHAEAGIAEIMRSDQERVSDAERIAGRTLGLDVATDNERLAKHQESRAKWAADEKAAIDAWYNAQSQAINAALADMEKLNRTSSEEYRNMTVRLEALDDDRLTRKKEIDRKMQQSENQTLTEMTSSFNSSLQKWISGEERFRYAWVGMWSGLLNTVTMYLIKMGEQELAMGLKRIARDQHLGIISETIHAASLLKKLIMTKVFHVQELSEDAAGASAKAVVDKTTAMLQVSTDAGQAAAAAFASVMEALPFPANVAAAPGVAAAALSATLAYGSFDEGGLAGRTGVAMIHQNEVVMPPDVSLAFRSLSAGAGVGGGNISVPIHMGSVSAIDARGVSKVLAQQGRAIQRSVVKAVRNSGAIARGGIRR